MRVQDRLIVALDVPTVKEAHIIFHQLKDKVHYFKVGFQLLYADLLDQSADLFSVIPYNRVFLDCNLTGIPNTLIGASESLRGEFAMISVMANSGLTALSKVALSHKDRSLVFAVTILTSLDETECRLIYGCIAEAAVYKFAMLAKTAGVDGIICSARDICRIKERVGLQELLIMCPAIRFSGDASSDQKRVSTPSNAIRLGADYIIMGRPIIRAEDPSTMVSRAQNAIYQARGNILLDKLFDQGHIKFGKFKLRLHDAEPNAPLSPIYLDLRRMNSDLLQLIGEVLAYTVDLEGLTFDQIEGIPNAGHPIAHSLAETLGQNNGRVTQNNLLQKGLREQIVCVKPPLKSPTKVLLVDDTIVHADTKIKSFQALERHDGFIVTDILVLVDRMQGGAKYLQEEFGKRVVSVVDITQMMQYYLTTKRITQETFDEVDQYLRVS